MTRLVQPVAHGITWHSPLGDLWIADDAEGICRVELRMAAPGPSDPSVSPGPLVERAREELEEYFAGVRQRFDVPLSLQGTPFQREAWGALRAIPYGETRTYGEQAQAIGRPRAYRAVGMANHRNPVIILVPCHRVLGSGGGLVGYAGGLEAKRRLLELEGALRS